MFQTKIGRVQVSAGSAIGDIEKIVDVVKEVGDIIGTIAAAIEEQAVVTKDVAGNIAQASAGVHEAHQRIVVTATASQSIATDMAGVTRTAGDIRIGGEQVAESSAELSRLAETLKVMVGKFKV
jgi:methyl-accepting chemotaxis protein